MKVSNVILKRTHEICREGFHIQLFTDRCCLAVDRASITH